MFFFDLTSQSVESPFAFDTMLRSAVPPHIGQSPVPGSEAMMRGAADRHREGREKNAARVYVSCQLCLLSALCSSSLLCSSSYSFGVSFKLSI